MIEVTIISTLFEFINYEKAKGNKKVENKFSVSVGVFGAVSVEVHTISTSEELEEDILQDSSQSNKKIFRRLSSKLQQDRRIRKATPDVDYEVRPLNVSFQVITSFLITKSSKFLILFRMASKEHPSQS